MKYLPIEACVQARAKLSNWSAAGSLQGLKRISGSVLKAVITIHRSGKITRMAQIIRKTCEMAVKATSPVETRSRVRAQREVVRAGAASGRTSGNWPAGVRLIGPYLQEVRSQK